MGLIKAAIGAVGSTFGDQWQDYIKCDEMDNDTLIVKKTTDSGQISEKSRIQVNPGQIAVIFDSGNIIDATAEEGIYTFDKSTSPSFFGGSFGAVFKEMWQRFKYDGAVSKEQAVFYINATEIHDNKFGTPSPVPYQDWSHPIPNQMTGTVAPMSLKVKCFGKYTFKITEPEIFMRTWASTNDIVKKDEIVEQMRSEVIGAFQNILNTLGNSENKIPVLELPSKTADIKKKMDENVFDDPIRKRGISIIGFVIESVTLDEDSDARITQYENNSNAYMQQGRVLDVMETAAGNEGGAATGFMGVGMMNMASGGMTGGVMQNAFNQTDKSSTNVQEIGNKFCPNCGAKAMGNFCGDCGTKLS